MKIFVVGATGQVGSQVLQSLSEKGIPTRALTRNLSRKKDLSLVEWVQGDLSQTLFLEGCTHLFLSTNVSGDMVAQQCRAIDAAREQGIGHVVNLSSTLARKDAGDSIGVWHWTIDEHLRQSGLKWNVLQPQAFMQNWLGDLADTVRTERKIYQPAGMGKKPFIDARDIGDVAAALFSGAGDIVCTDLPLSGPSAVSYDEVASAIGNAIGTPVTYVDQTEEQARARYVRKGLPERMIRIFLASALNQKLGLGEKQVSPNVERILGRPARSIGDFARDYAWAFKE